MYSLLYLNLMGFKLKPDCQIYANKNTCNLNIGSFFIWSEQTALFFSPFTCVPTDLSPLLYWWGGLEYHKLAVLVFWAPDKAWW